MGLRCQIGKKFKGTKNYYKIALYYHDKRDSSEIENNSNSNIQKINEIFNRLFTEKEILFKMSKNAGNIAITEATSNLSKLINKLK